MLTPCLAAPVPVGLTLHRSTTPLSPPARWDATEWHALLAGSLGPWAGLADHGKVVSLAHCARLTDTAAEVGVQTEEDAQGQGLAAIVVTAWIAQLVASRQLFYSAAEDNVASHRVVPKINGIPLGRIARTSLGR